MAKDEYDKLIDEANKYEQRLARHLSPKNQPAPGRVLTEALSDAHDTATLRNYRHLRGIYERALGAAGNRSDTAKIDLYDALIDTSTAIMDLDPDDRGAKQRLQRYESELKALEKSHSGELENRVLATFLGITYLFSLSILSPKITGNVIGSGNINADTFTGLILLFASLIGTYFFLDKKDQTHPEKKKKRKKKKKR